MGYRIVYRLPQHGRRRWWGIGFLCGLVVLSWLPQLQRLAEYVLIPGDRTVTRQAFALLLEHLRNGADMSQAVAAFCQHVGSGLG